MTRTPSSTRREPDSRKPVAEYAAIISEHGAPFVTSWIVAYEFTTASIDEDDESIDDVIIPATQTRATSRGLLGLALDHYTRRT